MRKISLYVHYSSSFKINAKYSITGNLLDIKIYDGVGYIAQFTCLFIYIAGTGTRILRYSVIPTEA